MRLAPLAALVLIAAAGCSSNHSTASTPPPTVPSQAGQSVQATTADSSAPAPATTSAAPAPVKAIDAAAVVGKLKNAGLPVGPTLIYTDANDPNHLLGRPGGYTSKASFADTRIDPAKARDHTPGNVELGGSVEVYPDAAGATARKAYIAKAEAANPIVGTEYDYLAGPVLLRVSQILTPAQAEAYAKALG